MGGWGCMGAGTEPRTGSEAPPRHHPSTGSGHISRDSVSGPVREELQACPPGCVQGTGPDSGTDCGLGSRLPELPLLALEASMPWHLPSLASFLLFCPAALGPCVPLCPRTLLPRPGCPNGGQAWPAPSSQCVSVHGFSRGGAGRHLSQGTRKGPSPPPRALGKGALYVVRPWSLPGASSRCGTLQIPITHSQGALSRLGVGMATGRWAGTMVPCLIQKSHRGYPQMQGHREAMGLDHHDCPRKQWGGQWGAGGRGLRALGSCSLGTSSAGQGRGGPRVALPGRPRSCTSALIPLPSHTTT